MVARRTFLSVLLASGAVLGGAPAFGQSAGDLGVLVMAHGGGTVWNAEVTAMLEPLHKDYPLEIAFGMADPSTIQDAVRKLEQRGARRIAVVRLFISGESWYERTEQILGVRPGAEPRAADSHAGHAGHAAAPAVGHGGHDMSLWRIETGAGFALRTEGLADAPEMGAVLVQRARGLSKQPQRESLLILAHGPETDDENARWLAKIDARAEAVRKAVPFREVRVETLREDWPEKRQAAEARVRGFVEQASRDGGTAIVIPYRVQGFGPYAKVLEGLTYLSDGKGLLPSPEVEQWVRRQVETMARGEFRKPMA